MKALPRVITYHPDLKQLVWSPLPEMVTLQGMGLGYIRGAPAGSGDCCLKEMVPCPVPHPPTPAESIVSGVKTAGVQPCCMYVEPPNKVALGVHVRTCAYAEHGLPAPVLTVSMMRVKA